MVVDVLIEVNKVLYDFEKVIMDPEQYVMLDDSIIDEILTTEDDRLEKAKEIIERMQYRKHYKCVGEKGLNKDVAEIVWNQITAEAIVEFQDEESDDKLLPEHIGVKKFIINHGLKKDHPLNNVKFFDKKSGIKNSYNLVACKKESMLPKDNMSWTVRCFVKPICDKKI